MTILNDSETEETEVATSGVKLLSHSRKIFHNDSDYRLWRRILGVTPVGVRDLSLSDIQGGSFNPVIFHNHSDYRL